MRQDVQGPQDRHRFSNQSQRTPEWFKARAGKLTASSFGTVLGMIGSRRALWRQSTGREVLFENPAMARGTLVEPLAIEAYLAALDGAHDLSAGPMPSSLFQQVGFIVHPNAELNWLGASPDGFMGLDVVAEMKAPNPREDGTLELYEGIPPYYMPQIQGLLEITDRYVCDFVCWTPGAVKVWQVEREPAYWAWMLPHLAEFMSYIEGNIEPPKFKRGKKPVFPGTVRISDPAVYTAF